MLFGEKNRAEVYDEYCDEVFPSVAGSGVSELGRLVVPLTGASGRMTVPSPCASAAVVAQGGP